MDRLPPGVEPEARWQVTYDPYVTGLCGIRRRNGKTNTRRNDDRDAAQAARIGPRGLCRKGVSGTSMDSVTAKIGLMRGVLYHRFGHKKGHWGCHRSNRRAPPIRGLHASRLALSSQDDLFVSRITISADHRTVIRRGVMFSLECGPRASSSSP
ncbi:hypothetical protein ACFQXB_01070 [Plastorhodobacter daqingensis]|uniref:Transposase n=1 Tax=Plastorhodobacter daqingensis TaxID=1387281 RepID=A0ABW2UDM3_9RHOB